MRVRPRFILMNRSEKSHASRFQRAYRISNRFVQLQSNGHRSFSASWELRGGRMQTDGQALSSLDRGELVTEAVSKPQPKGVAVKTNRQIHIRNVNCDISSVKHLLLHARHGFA